MRRTLRGLEQSTVGAFDLYGCCGRITIVRYIKVVTVYQHTVIIRDVGCPYNSKLQYIFTTDTPSSCLLSWLCIGSAE